MHRKKRKRKYIPFPERLAAALAMLLPIEQRDKLRAYHLPAEAVLKLFEFDHNILHCPPFKGPDKWWNLTPIQKRPHIEKTKVDRKVIAKVDRIIAREKEHEAARRRVLRSHKRAWPKRKIHSRPFRTLAK